MEQSGLDVADALYQRAQQHFRQYLKTRATEDIAKAIDQLRRATSGEGHRRTEHLSLLASALYEYAMKVRDENDVSLDEAVKLEREVINIHINNGYDTTELKAMLGSMLYEVFVMRNNASALNESISIMHEVIANTTFDTQTLAQCRNTLASILKARFEYEGGYDNLEEAVRIIEPAIAVFEAHDPTSSLPACLNTLGNILGFRWNGDETSSDNNTAIECFKRALELVKTDLHKATIIKTNIVERLTARYWRLGEMSDLSDAIQLLQEAIKDTMDDDSDLPGLRANLANLFTARYLAGGAVSDLDTAIDLVRRAIDAKRSSFLSFAIRHGNLAEMLRLRYARTSEASDLEQAEFHAREAVKKTPDNSASLHIRHFNLGLILGDIYAKMPSKARLAEAVRWVRTAIDGPSDQYPTELEKANYLDTLATLLGDEFVRHPEIETIRDAILASQECLSMTPTIDRMRGERLYHLGMLYMRRHAGSHKEDDDQSKAIENLEASLEYTRGRIRPRITAGQIMLEHYAEAGNWQEAYKVAKRVVQLVPLLASRSIDQADTQHLLLQVVGLASDAAAAALHATEDPRVAIEMLEIGRCVLAGSLSKLREDVSMLVSAHPALAAEFLQVRQALDPSWQVLSEERLVGKQSGYGNSRTSLRYAAEKDLDLLLANIRRKPEFEDFLVPSRADSMMVAARDCPIVLVNASKYRCDALIIEASRICFVPLQTLDLEHADSYGDDEFIHTDLVQEWLWDEIAKPILETLGFKGVPTNPVWPRIRWILTGPLSRFPIHAAGYHAQKGRYKTVLDRVVSSYSVSVEAIISSQRRVLKEPGNQSALLISMKHTPEQDSLPHASEEIDLAKRWCNTRQLEITQCSCNKAAVLECLKSCTFFHFAGHGALADDDPMKSRLLLEDWQSDPLTVADVLNVNAHGHQPYLAYLSACRTGQIRGEKYLDESIHLISVFQLAGFRNVVGSLWKIDDESSMHVARAVYQTMEECGMSDSTVAIGVHKAVRELRDQWLANFQPVGATNRDERLAEVGDASLAGARGLRTSSPVLEPRSPYWIPYVHYGG